MAERVGIGVVGAGAMAQAFVRGVVRSGVAMPEEISVNNRTRRDEIEAMRRLGARHAQSKAQLAADAGVLVIAVKPKDASEVLEQLRPHMRGQLVLSMMAGVPTRFIAQRLGDGARVLRAMANTSSAVRESATAMARGALATDGDVRQGMELLSALGPVVEVEEGLLDAVTALSGSGPAYVYLMVESLISAGEEQGLSAEVARLLVLQTVYGAARMLIETGERPENLRGDVTSPGGTTRAALDVLERAGFPEIVRQAVRRARERSGELGEAWGL